ncbi:MAG: hypothetical protein V3V45_07395, partial [Candidatus Brocadiales bacterium]
MAGIRFKETMDGTLGENIKDFRTGEDYGIRHKNEIKFDVEIEIDSVDKFISVSSHLASLRGEFFCKSLGGEEGMTINNGTFNLFSIGTSSGHREMLYRFNFNAPDGKEYYFSGVKDIFNDKGIDIFEDMTTLFVGIYEGNDDTGRIYGSGVMYFRIGDLRSLIKMLKSSEVTGAKYPWTKWITMRKFMAFVIKETWKTYAPPVARFVYDTKYENLVLSGNLRADGEDSVRPFFFFSGEHEKGFPWGDDTAMSDVALLIADGSGKYQRFGITWHSLEGL